MAAGREYGPQPVSVVPSSDENEAWWFPNINGVLDEETGIRAQSHWKNFFSRYFQEYIEVIAKTFAFRKAPDNLRSLRAYEKFDDKNIELATKTVNHLFDLIRRRGDLGARGDDLKTLIDKRERVENMVITESGENRDLRLTVYRHAIQSMRIYLRDLKAAPQIAEYLQKLNKVDVLTADSDTMTRAANTAREVFELFRSLTTTPGRGQKRQKLAAAIQAVDDKNVESIASFMEDLTGEERKQLFSHATRTSNHIAAEIIAPFL